jgi:lysozyme family protein
VAEFNPAFEKTLCIEGGYSDRADDRGGKTKFGITEEVARENGYLGEMKELPREIAERIYLKRYWFPLRLSDVTDQALAEELFDTGVNCGLGRVKIWWQMALNALNARGTIWPDIAEDGAIGKETIETTKKAVDLKRGERIRKVLNILQGAHYVGLARKEERYETFLGGWLDNRVRL